MSAILWIVVAVITFACILLYVGCIKLERRRAVWDEWYHPPDMEVKDDEPDPGP